MDNLTKHIEALDSIKVHTEEQRGAIHYAKILIKKRRVELEASIKSNFLNAMLPDSILEYGMEAREKLLEANLDIGNKLRK